MFTRALSASLLSVTVASLMLAGCGGTPLRANLPSVATKKNLGFAAKDLAKNGDPLPFVATAKRAIDLMNKEAGWKNPKLVCIEGRGFDQDGRTVPLLGSSYTFKFWAQQFEDNTLSEEIQLVAVIVHVEGNVELAAVGENKTTDTLRVLDPDKLSIPTDVVPFAIRLGLRVGKAGPAYHWYDVTYNSFYANPSRADTDVADVSSNYQREILDGLHIPAQAGLLPKLPAATPGAPAKPPAAPAGTKRMTAAELAAEAARKSRQHNG